MAAAKLDEYFSPKKNIRYECYLKKKHAIDQFASRLRTLSENFEFDNIDDTVADQILASSSSTCLKENILCKEKAVLKDILAYGRAIESSKQQVAEITDKTKAVEINALEFSSCDRQRTQSKTCRHCGGIWLHDRSKPCPAKGKECQ